MKENNDGGINEWGHSLETPPIWWKKKNEICVVDRINAIFN